MQMMYIQFEYTSTQILNLESYHLYTYTFNEFFSLKLFSYKLIRRIIRCQDSTHT